MPDKPVGWNWIPQSQIDLQLYGPLIAHYTEGPFGIGGEGFGVVGGTDLTGGRFGFNVPGFGIVSPSQVTGGVFGIGVRPIASIALNPGKIKIGIEDGRHGQPPEPAPGNAQQGSSGAVGAGGSVGPAGQWPAASISRVTFPAEILPVFSDHTPDARFTRQTILRYPNGFPTFPGGTRLIRLESMDETRQEDLMYHADPRLIAANRGPEPMHGTPVADLTVDGDISVVRQAQLQTMIRIVREPRKPNGEGGPNVAAWNIGTTGIGEALAGMVVDNSWGDPRVGRVSRADGGPFAIRGTKCKHRIGTDYDGAPIGPVHLGTDSLFAWNDADDVHDGPLAFTIEPHPKDPLFIGFEQQVRIGWDPLWQAGNGGKIYRGAWRAWTRCLIGTTTTPGGGGYPPDWVGTPGGEDPPDDGVATPGGEDPPEGGGGGGGGGSPEGEDPRDPIDILFPDKPILPPGPPINRDPQRRNTTVSQNATRDLLYRDHAVVAQALGTVAQVYKARHVVEGSHDIAYDVTASPEAASEFVAESPAVLRVEAYGQQSGDGWVRTQDQSKSTHRGGTANGGIWYTVPEVGLEDIPSGLTSDSTRNVSAGHVGLGPGVTLGFGLPSLTTGLMQDGWQIGRVVATDDLVFANVVSGTSTLKTTWTSTELEMADGYNMKAGSTTGTKVGTASTEKLGFWGASPIVRPSSTGTTAGFTPGGGTAVTDESTFTGDAGSTAYRISDIVKHLKRMGMLAT